MSKIMIEIITENSIIYSKVTSLLLNMGMPLASIQRLRSFKDLPNINNNHPALIIYDTNLELPSKELKNYILLPIPPDPDQQYFIKAVELSVKQLSPAKTTPDNQLISSDDSELPPHIKLLEASDEPIAVTNAEGRFIRVNDAFEKTFGYESNELLGKPFGEIIDAGDIKNAVHFESSIKGTMEVQTHKVIIIHKDRSALSMTWKAIWSDDKLYSLFKKPVQEADRENLLIASVRLKRIQQMSKIGYCELNLQTNELYWSDETYAIWGKTKGEFFPTMDFLIQNIAPEDLNDFNKTHEEALKNKNETELEHRIILSDNSIRWIRLKISPILSAYGEVTDLAGIIQDITGEKLKEETIRKNHERFILAAKTTGDAIWEYEVSTGKLIWSEGFHKLFGYDPELIGHNMQSWSINTHPEDKDRVVKSFYDAIDNPEMYFWKEEYRYKCADEHIAYVIDNGYIVRNEHGKAERMIGAVKDITDLVEKEQELTFKNKIIFDILENITDGFFSIDCSWRITYWNKSSEHICKLQRNEVLNRSIWDVFPDMKDTEFYQVWQKAMKEQSPYQFEAFFTPLSIWVDFSIYPNKDGLTVFYRDISSERAHRMELLRLKNNVEAMINSVNEMVWSVDAECKIISINEAFRKAVMDIFKKEIKEGDFILEGINFQNRQKWESYYLKALDGEQFSVTEEYLDKDNRTRYNMINFNPIYNESEIVGVACFSKDLTENMEQLYAIETQNQQLMQIAWEQSHIVRAPLARLMGLINILSLKGTEIDQRLEILNLIQKSATELDQIIREIVRKTEKAGLIPLS